MGGKFGGGSSNPGRVKRIISLLNEEGAAAFVDFLVGLCLSLMLFGLMQQVAGMVYTVHSTHLNQAELQYSARMALDCIQREIRAARDFKVSEDGSKLMITDAEDKNIYIFVKNNNLYRQDVSCTPVAENLSAVHFRKTAAGLQGNLELNGSKSNYGLDFYCYARSLQE